MKKLDKLLKFMSEYEGNGEYKTFDFYHSHLKGRDVERYENGKVVLFAGDDLQKLKEYIKEKDDKKVQLLLRDAGKKEYLYCNRQGLPLAHSYYCDLELTDIGRQHLENLNEIKRKWLMTIIPALIAFVGSLFISYNFPNETKIQTIVKTELKNTNNINIK